MQEMTIGWDPVYEGRLPWCLRLFISYLAAVLVMFCFRAIRMLLHLRRLQNAAQEVNEFWLTWDSCHAKTVSIKNWVGLTFLLSFLVSAWSMTGTLRGIIAEKLTGTAFLAGATAEVLTTFCFGMFVCAVLYAFGFFYETQLLRHKSRQRLPRP